MTRTSLSGPGSTSSAEAAILASLPHLPADMYFVGESELDKALLSLDEPGEVGNGVGSVIRVGQANNKRASLVQGPCDGLWLVQAVSTHDPFQ